MHRAATLVPSSRSPHRRPRLRSPYVSWIKLIPKQDGVNDTGTKQARRELHTIAHRLDLATALPASVATAATPFVLPLVGIPAPAVLIPALLELGLMILEPNANCICCARVALGETG